MKCTNDDAATEQEQVNHKIFAEPVLRHGLQGILVLKWTAACGRYL